MFALSCSKQIDLTQPRLKRSGILAAYTEQQNFGYVSKLKPDAASI